jgi:hypothetical protein
MRVERVVVEAESNGVHHSTSVTFSIHDDSGHNSRALPQSPLTDEVHDAIADFLNSAAEGDD